MEIDGSHTNVGRGTGSFVPLLQVAFISNRTICFPDTYFWGAFFALTGGVLFEYLKVICKSPELCTGRKVLIIKIYTRSTPYFLCNVTFDAPVFFYSLLTKFNVVQGLSQRQRIPSVGVYNQNVKFLIYFFYFLLTTAIFWLLGHY